MEFLNRDQVRQILVSAGINSETVTDSQITELRQIMNRHFRDAGIYNGTACLASAKSDLKFLDMKTSDWDRREAVSFNADGFIGIAGWASDQNVQPILTALVEWCKG